jgi:hypothetical protein
MSMESRLARGFGAFVLFAAGYLVSASGILSRPSNIAQAELTPTKGREAFKAGSERSEGTLKEIADTLKRIESRVEKIEQAATRGQSAK